MTTEDVYRLKTMHALDPPEKAWKHFSALFDLTPLRMSKNSGSIENYTWIAGTSVFAQVSLDGNLHYHTDDHLSRSGDLLFVHRYLTGGANGRSGDVPYMMRPGSIIFHDYGRPFEGVQMPSTIQSVFLRHELVGYDPNRMPPQLVFDQSSSVGAALFSAFDTLMEAFLGGAPTLEIARERHLASLVNAALPDPDARPSSQMQIQQYIESSLPNPALSATDIQSTFELSRAQLFERFSAYGGFSQYVSTRRVFHTLLGLEKSPDRLAQVGEIATDWGFRSEDAFRDAVQSLYQTDLETMFAR